MKPQFPNLSSRPSFKNPNGAAASRWKWMASSSAALGVASGVANAEIVQIVQVNNQASNDGTNTLKADLTGDGNDDLVNLMVILGAKSLTVTDSHYYNSTMYTLRRLGSGGFGVNYEVGFGVFNSSSSFFSSVPMDKLGLVTVRFTDARINGGHQTTALLEVRARNLSQTSHQVIFTRLIFDNESTAKPAAMAGTPYPDAFPTDNTALRASLTRKLKREKRKLRKARMAGNSTKVRKIRKKIQKFRRQLRAL